MILLTISDIGDEPVTPEIIDDFLIKFEDHFTQLEIKNDLLDKTKSDLSNIEEKKNQIQQSLDIINNKPLELKKLMKDIKNQRDVEINKLGNQSPEEQEKTKKNIISIYDRLLNELTTELTIAEEKREAPALHQNFSSLVNNESILNEQRRQTELEIKQIENNYNSTFQQYKLKADEAQATFLKKPQDWVYHIGLPISTSVLLAVTALLFGEGKYKIIHDLALKFSIVFIGLAFVFALVIFFIIGKGPSYFGWG